MQPCPEAKAQAKPCGRVWAAGDPVLGWHYEVSCPKLGVAAEGISPSQTDAWREVVLCLSKYNCGIIDCYIPPLKPFAL